MAGWRETRRKAKAVIHATFEVPAVYLTHAAGIPLRLTVRDHTKNQRIENEFSTPNAPGFLDTEPTIIFQISDQLPASMILNKSFVFISSDEVFRIGSVEPPVKGYVRCSVVPANDAEIATVVADIEAAGYGEEWDGIYP